MVAGVAAKMKSLLSVTVAEVEEAKLLLLGTNSALSVELGTP